MIGLDPEIMKAYRILEEGGGTPEAWRRVVKLFLESRESPPTWKKDKVIEGGRVIEGTRYSFSGPIRVSKNKER